MNNTTATTHHTPQGVPAMTREEALAAAYAAYAANADAAAAAAKSAYAAADAYSVERDRIDKEYPQ